MLRDIFSIAIQNLNSRRLRSFLTVLGVIVGIAAIVGLVTFANSIEGSVIGELEKFGTDVISLTEGHIDFESDQGSPWLEQPSRPFTQSEMEKIERIPGVGIMYGSTSDSVSIGYGGEERTLTVTGINDFDAWWEIEIEKIGLEEGRTLSGDESYSAVIGHNVAHEVFEDEITERKRITINEIDFRVVGILNEVGGFIATADSSIFIPVTMRDEIVNYTVAEDEYTAVSLKVSEGYDTEEVADAIEELLFDVRNEDEDTQTFTVISPAFYRDTVSTILNTMTALVTGIAAISLITGGIGIMNIMYASVAERTKEIGVMKAVGATNNTVLSLIVMEAGLTGLIGGIVGALVGIVGAFGMSIAFSVMFEGTLSIGVIVHPEIPIVGCIVGFIVGAVAGFLPARSASKLEPVEALSYE